ncbi:MAG: hypothetical protein ABL921_24405, partial [Pirellula sp.]
KMAGQKDEEYGSSLETSNRSYGKFCDMTDSMESSLRSSQQRTARPLRWKWDQTAMFTLASPRIQTWNSFDLISRRVP